MRADRLLSILMLLQARSRITAAALARELEVSERTIYRDIDALSAAGVPVFAERGPGGGCALIEGYRTSLTGLKEDEVRALFMLSIPAPLVELGVKDDLRAALRKLAAALPAGRRGDEDRMRQRVHIDWSGWAQPAAPGPHLQTVQAAIWADRVLRLTYQAEFGTQISRTVAPYGLVAKAGAWYLVCALDDHLKAYRVSQIVDVRVLEQHCNRPADFDLVRFWETWCAERAVNRPSYPVTARVAPELVPLLPHYFGDRLHEQLAQAAPADPEGWLILILPFETLEAARERILGFGWAVEVLAPEPLRRSVLDFAQQILAFYATRPS